MRTKDNTLDLANLDFNRFKSNMKQAIEHFSGSPVKKEAKVYEACAIALGDENSDRLAASLKRTQLEAGSALALAKAGLCPFTMEPLDSDIVQRLGAKLHVDEAQGKLVIDRFPDGMQQEERILWSSAQPKNEVVVLDGSSGSDEAPHLHAAIAGYRNDLSHWFLSMGEEAAAYTLCYWHSNHPPFMGYPLATRLQHETHYELVLSLSDNGKAQGLHLYRIFKLGQSWQLSQDESISLAFEETMIRDRTPVLDSALRGILSLVIEQAVQRPARLRMQDGDPKNHEFIQLVEKAVECHFENHSPLRDASRLKRSALEMIHGSLRAFDDPVHIANLLNDPVMHPIDA